MLENRTAITSTNTFDRTTVSFNITYTRGRVVHTCCEHILSYMLGIQ